MFFKKVTKIVIKDFSKPITVICRDRLMDVDYKNSNFKTKQKGSTLYIMPHEYKEAEYIQINCNEIQDLTIDHSSVEFLNFSDFDSTDLFNLSILNDSKVSFNGFWAVHNFKLNIGNSHCVFQKELAAVHFDLSVIDCSFLDFRNKGYIDKMTLNVDSSVVVSHSDFICWELLAQNIVNVSDVALNVFGDSSIEYMTGQSSFLIRGTKYTQHRADDSSNVYFMEHKATSFLKKCNRDFDCLDESYVLFECIGGYFEYPPFIKHCMENLEELIKESDNPVEYKNNKKHELEVDNLNFLKEMIKNKYPTEEISNLNRKQVVSVLKFLMDNPNSLDEFSDQDLIKIKKMCFVLDIEFKKNKQLAQF